MGKISKSDTLDKAHEQAERETVTRLLSSPVKHWEPGAPVLWRGRSYVLASILGDMVTLVGSGEVLTIRNPFFTQWGSPWRRG